jgi:glyoxylase-like metal-dependent hydrolase (beta-lactamase superfamily II)
MKITENVYAFPQFIGEDRKIFPAGIKTEEGLILVDAGMPDQVEKLEEELKQHGFKLPDVEKIILTHQDPDHCGALKEVVQRTNAITFAYEDDAPYIDGRKDPIKAEERYLAVEIDVELNGGEKFNSRAGKVEVVETPGHAPGHISLLIKEEKLLIAGDALTAGEKLQGPWKDFTLEMDEAYRSLYNLKFHEFEETHCFHGGFVEEGSEEVDKIFSEYEGLEKFEKAEVEKTAFLRRNFDLEKVGLSRFQLEAGEKHGARENPEAGHRHSRQEEIYLFLKGSGEVRLEEEKINYSEGTAVKVEPHCFRRIDAEEDTDFVVAGAPIEGDEAEYGEIW